MPAIINTVNVAREEVFDLPVLVGDSIASRIIIGAVSRIDILDLDAPPEARGTVKADPTVVSTVQSTKITLSLGGLYENSTVRSFSLNINTNLLQDEQADATITLNYPGWEYRHYWEGGVEYYDKVNLTFKLTVRAFAYICSGLSGTVQLTGATSTVNFTDSNDLFSLGTATVTNSRDLYGLKFTTIAANRGVKPVDVKLFPYFKYSQNQVDLFFRVVPKKLSTPLLDGRGSAFMSSAFLPIPACAVEFSLGVTSCTSVLIAQQTVVVQVKQPQYEIENYPKVLELTTPSLSKFTYTLTSTTAKGLNGLSCPAYVEKPGGAAITAEYGWYVLPNFPRQAIPYRQRLPWEQDGAASSGSIVPLLSSPASIAEAQTFTFYQGEYSEAFVKIKSPETFATSWTLMNPPTSLGTLTLNNQGKLSGVPALVSTNTVNVAVANVAGATTKSINIQILAGRPEISNIPTQSIEALKAYSYTPNLTYGTASGWSLHGPRGLPQGLSLNATTGQLTGQVTTASAPILDGLSASTEIWDFTKYSDADFTGNNFYSNFSTPGTAVVGVNSYGTRATYFRQADKSLRVLTNNYALALPVRNTQQVNRTYAFWLSVPYDNGALLYRPGDTDDASITLIELAERSLVFKLSCYNKNISAAFSNVVKTLNTGVTLSKQWNFIVYVVNTEQKSITGYLNGIKIAEINASMQGVLTSNVVLTNLNTYGLNFDYVIYTLDKTSIFSGDIAYCAVDSTAWTALQVFNAYYYTNPFKPWTAGNKYFTCLKALSPRGESREVAVAFETRIAPPKIVANQEIITGHGIAVKKIITVEDSDNRPVSNWKATGLPAGLQINATTGEITGSVSCIKNSLNEFFITTNYSPTITASNSAGSNSVTIKITVYPIPVIESGQVFGFALGSSVNVSIALDPSTFVNPLQSQVTSWSTTAPGFKEGDYYHISALGLKLNLRTGEISGVVSKYANNYQIQVTAKSLEDISPVAGEYAPHLTSLPQTVSFSVAYGAPKIVGGGSTTDFKLNSYAKYTVVAEDTANRPIYSWNASGLPLGLAINTQTGVIEGTPYVAGTYTSTVIANGAGVSNSASFNFKILANLKDDGTITMVYGEPVPSIKVVGSLPVISDWDIIGIPGWMTFNKATRTLEGTTATSTVGSATGSLAWRALLTPKHTYTQAAKLTGIGAGSGEVSIGYNDTTVYMNPVPTEFNVTLPWKAPAGEKITGVVGSKYLLGISTNARTYWYSKRTTLPAEFPTTGGAISSWNMRSFRTNMRGYWYPSTYFDEDWIFLGGDFYGYDLVKATRSTSARYSYAEANILENAVYISDRVAIRMYTSNNTFKWDYVGRITSGLATYFNNRCAALTKSLQDYLKITFSCAHTWNTPWKSSYGSGTTYGTYLPQPEGYTMDGWLILNGKLEDTIYATGRDQVVAFGQQSFASYGYELGDYGYTYTRYSYQLGKIYSVLYHRANLTAWINYCGDLEYNFGTPNGLIRPRSSCDYSSSKNLESYYIRGREAVLNGHAEYVSGSIVYLGSAGYANVAFTDTFTTVGDTLVLDFEILPGVPIIHTNSLIILAVLGEPVSWMPSLVEPVFRAPLVWNVQYLPSGLTFNHSTGQITGTLYEHFNGTFKVTATNNAGSHTVTVGIGTRERVKLLQDNQILRGKVGEFWSSQLAQLTVAGWEDVTWKIPVGSGQPGELPIGLSYDVSSTGAITIKGKPGKLYLASTVAGIKEYHSVQISAVRNSDGLESSPQLVNFEIGYGAPKLASGWTSAPELETLNWINLEGADYRLPASLLTYGNGKFVACEYVSTNGLNFSLNPGAGFFSTKSWAASIFADGKFFVFSADGKTVAQSTDGVFWTQTQLTTALKVGHIAYGNSVMVSLNSLGGCSYSSNFTTWTNATLPYPSGYSTTKLIYGNGRFYILANARLVDTAGALQGYNSMIFSSVNGVDWTSVTRSYTTAGSFVESIAAHTNGALLGSLKVYGSADSTLLRSYDHGASFGGYADKQQNRSHVESDGTYIMWSGSAGGFLSSDATVLVDGWKKVHARGNIRYSNGKFLYYYSDRVAYAAPMADVVDFKLSLNESTNFKKLALETPESRPLTSYIVKNKRTNNLVAGNFSDATFSGDFSTHLSVTAERTPNIISLELLGVLKYPLNIDKTVGSNILSVTLIGPGGTSTADVLVNVTSPGELTPPFPQQGDVSGSYNCYKGSTPSNITTVSLGVEYSEVTRLEKQYWYSQRNRLADYNSRHDTCFTPALPDAVVGENYQQLLIAVGYYISGSTSALIQNSFADTVPLKVSIPNSNQSEYRKLPEGLSLENWFLTGSPTKAGTYIIRFSLDTVRFEWMKTNFNNRTSFGQIFYNQIKNQEAGILYTPEQKEALEYFDEAFYPLSNGGWEFSLTVIDVPVPVSTQEVFVTLGKNFTYTAKLFNEEIRGFVTSWNLSPSPQGIFNYSTTTGEISGTVSDVSLVGTTKTFTLKATSAIGGKYYDKLGELRVYFNFQAPSLSDGSFAILENTDIREYLYSQPSAIAPITSFRLVEGILPPGTSFDTATGILTGKATTHGKYTFKIQAIGPGGYGNTVTIVVEILKAPRKIVPGQKLVTSAHTPFNFSIKTSGGYAEDFLSIADDTPQLGEYAPKNTTGTSMSMKDVVDTWYTPGTFKFVGSAEFITARTFTGVKLPRIPLSNSRYYNAQVKLLNNQTTHHWTPCGGNTRAYILANANSDILGYSTDAISFTFFSLPVKETWRFIISVPAASAIVGEQGIALSITDRSLKYWKYASFVSLGIHGASTWVAGPSPSEHNEDDVFLMLFSNSNTNVYTSRDGGNTWKLNSRTNNSGVVVAMGDLSGTSTSSTPRKAAYALSYCVAGDSRIVALVQRGQDTDPVQALSYIVSIDKNATRNSRWQAGRYVPGNAQMLSVQASVDRIVLVGSTDKTYYVNISEHLNFDQPMQEGGRLPSTGTAGNSWQQLIYAKNIFLAAKKDILSDNDIASSADNGSTWQAVSLPKLPNGCRWGNLSYSKAKGKFSLISQTSTTDSPEVISNSAYILFSDDGVSWNSEFYIKATFGEPTSKLLSPFEKIYLDVKPLAPSLPQELVVNLEQFKVYENFSIKDFSQYSSLIRPIDSWEITGLPSSASKLVDGVEYPQKLNYAAYYPGRLFGVAPAAGIYSNITVKIFNSAGEASSNLILKVNAPSPIIKPNQVFVVCVGDYQVDSVTKAVTAREFSITPELIRDYPNQTITWGKYPTTSTEVFPKELTLNAQTGAISGKLKIPGDYVLRIGAVSEGAPIRKELITIRAVKGVPKIKPNQEFLALTYQNLTAPIALEDSLNSPATRWELQSVYIPNEGSISGYGVGALDGLIQKTSYPTYETSRKTIVLTVKAWNTEHLSFFGFYPTLPATEIKVTWIPLPELRDYQTVYGEVGVPIKLGTLAIDDRGLWTMTGNWFFDNYMNAQDLLFKDGATAKYMYTANRYLDNAYAEGKYVIAYSNGTYTGTSPAFKPKPESIGLVLTLRYPEGIYFPTLSSAPALMGTPTKKISFTADISAGIDAGQSTKSINVNIRGGVPRIVSNQTFVGYAGYSFEKYLKIEDGLNRPVQQVAVVNPQNPLPAGLLMTASGDQGVRIHGTPTAAASRRVQIQVYGENPATFAVTYLDITIYDQLPRLKANSTYYVEVGKLVTLELEADPAFSPACTWRLNEGAPSLRLDKGKLVGSFSAVGTWAYWVSAGTCDNIYGPTASLTVTVVSASPDLLSPQAFTGKQGVSLNVKIAMRSRLSYLGTYAWEASGLPAGLTVHSLGYIEGTPAVFGEFESTVKLSSSAGSSTALITFSITKGSVLFSFSPITMWVNEEFSQVLEVSRGEAAQWEALGLPVGITLDTLTGELKGNPRTPGTVLATVTVTGVDFSKYTGTLKISVVQKIIIAKSQVIYGVAGVNLYYKIVYSKPLTLEILSWSATNLPNGLTINKAGEIKGIPTAGGTGVMQVTAVTATSSTTESISISILGGLPLIAENQNFTGRVGEELTAEIQAEELLSRPVSSWRITLLPPGLTAAANIVTGIPTAKGTFSSLAEATNVGGTSKKTVTFTITEGAPKIKEAQILGFSTFLTINAQKIQLVDTVNRPASSWQVDNLPPGLVLDSSAGVITGTVAEGFYTVEVTASGPGGVSEKRAVSLIAATTQAKIYKNIKNELLILGENTQAVFYELKQGNIPEGLTFNSLTGKLSGIAKSADTSYLGIEITNPDGTKELKAVVISVLDPPPQIAPQTKIYKLLNLVNDYTLNFSGKVTKFSVTALPEGLQFDETSGRIFGTPVKLQTVSAVVKVENDGGFAEASLTFEIVAEYLAPALTPFISTYVTYRNRYMQHVQVQNTGGPVETWEVSGLPDGLSFENYSQTLKGKPTLVGDPVVTFKASNLAGSSTVNLNLQIISEILKPVIARDQVYSVVVDTPIAEKVILFSGAADSYTLLDKLPESLSFNSTTGEITGKLDNVGETNVALTASNSEQTSEIEILKFIALSKKQSSAPVVRTSQIITFYLQEESTYRLYTDDNYGFPTAWKLAEGYSLPAGLLLNLATGEISGRPKNLGTTTVKVIASNSVGNSSSTEVQFNVLPSALRPVLAAGQKIQGVEGQEITQLLLATNSPTSWGVVDGSLPNKLYLNTSTGEIYGTLQTVGNYVVKIYVENSYGRTEETVEIIITTTAPEIVKNQIIEGFVGESLQYNVKYSKGVPASWSVEGTLPEGIIFDALKGEFIGNPTQAGNTAVTVKANNSGGESAEVVDFSIAASEKLSLVPSQRYYGKVGTLFGAQIIHTGAAPERWASSSTLPTGLVLDTATGKILGTPTQSGVTSFNVTGYHKLYSSSTANISIEIFSSSTSVKIVTSQSYTFASGSSFNFTPTVFGVIILWRFSGLPETVTINSETGKITGTLNPGEYKFTLICKSATATATGTIKLKIT